MKSRLYILTFIALISDLSVQAAPVLENSVTAYGQTSTITLETPAGTRAGDLLVAVIAFDGGKSVDLSAPSGWSGIRRDDRRAELGMALYCRIASENEPGRHLFSTGGTTGWSAGISRISGADSQNPIAASNSRTGRKGDVIAPSVTTRDDDTLVLAFYSNRRAVTYTPDPSTAKQYDRPNETAGLPSNMLATFDQPTAATTDNKTARPARNDRQWVAMQVAVNGTEKTPPPAEDRSGFDLLTFAEPVAGDTCILQVANATDFDGTPLSGETAVIVTDSRSGERIFDDLLLFGSGYAAAPLLFTEAAAHPLSLSVSGVTAPADFTVDVLPRPVTVTADSGQSKTHNAPDPELTWTLSNGSLMPNASLNGALTRMTGEAPGIYSILQGSLNSQNNPNYAITLVPATFEILVEQMPPPPPPPSPPDGNAPAPAPSGIWTSAEELADFPMSGTPWQKLKEDADTYWGIPNLSDQEDKANIYTMSKALVYARTGIEAYRTDVIEACIQAIGTEEGGRVLALARNLAAFVIAADLVGLPPEEDALFRDWLSGLLNKQMADGYSLVSCHEKRPNNWGTYAGASRAAVAAYLDDPDELDRTAQVFKGWLGDRSSYSDFRYGDLSWQADPDQPVGINPKNSTIQGYNVDGVMPDEQRVAGSFTWPPPQSGSAYECLQGALAQAVILSRAGYDVWSWEDQALRRAFAWLHNVATVPASGDDLWESFIVNSFCDAQFPLPTVSESGKNISRTCWTHPEGYVVTLSGTAPDADPGTDPGTEPEPETGDLAFYPGEYSDSAVIGNSLPGTWRPFSADSPWNKKIASDATTHPDSGLIMNFIRGSASKIRFGNEYLVPLWVVNSDNALPVGTTPNPDRPMDLHWVHVNSPHIFDTWDQDENQMSDIPIPLAKGTYSEPTADGHICIIDPFKKVAYEMSRHYGWTNDVPTCTTFNVWDLTGDGVGDPFEGKKWWARGGRGSGFPLIAGMLRPEEVLSGEIRHPLIFTFSQNRRSDDGQDQIMIRPPACRSDGQHIGQQYPIEGMLFQLDPSLTDADFNSWGLTAEGKVLARALQEYGMYLCDIGGDMALQVQMLGPTKETNRAKWDELVPGFYSTVNRIPTSSFRIIYNGEPTLR